MCLQVVCPECGLGFQSRAVFRVHRSRLHNPNNAKNNAKQVTDDHRVACAECGLVVHKHSLKRHMETHRPDRETLVKQTFVRLVGCETYSPTNFNSMNYFHHVQVSVQRLRQMVQQRTSARSTPQNAQ